jgi:hypothetical protein
MSNYIKSTNFAVKDGLAVGTAAKRVRGTEIDDEFNAIATASATKANANNATLTGNPTAPTQSAGNSSTRIATTAFVQAAVTAAMVNGHAYPVGSIYTSISSTNPATLLGVGTWAAFGAGRTLVGLDASQTEFDTVEETGGSKTHTLTEAEMPSHTHTYKYSDQDQVELIGSTITDISEVDEGGSTRTTNSTGGGSAHNNLQPYITVYFWKRTA